MALERKDVKVRFDDNFHKALSIIAERDGMGLGEWCEKVAVVEIKRRIHDAQSIAEETKDLGINGNQWELPGLNRK
jgi:hypothetical protein